MEVAFTEATISRIHSGAIPYLLNPAGHSSMARSRDRSSSRTPLYLEGGEASNEAHPPITRGAGFSSLAAHADTTPAKPVRGPRGGCYIVVKSKQGKAYKKYVDSKQCPKEAK